MSTGAGFGEVRALPLLRMNPGQQRDLVVNNINGSCDSIKDGAPPISDHIKRQSGPQDTEEWRFDMTLPGHLREVRDQVSGGSPQVGKGGCGFLVDGENVGGCGCSTPRHSDHISLSSSWET